MKNISLPTGAGLVSAICIASAAIQAVAEIGPARRAEAARQAAEADAAGRAAAGVSAASGASNSPSTADAAAAADAVVNDTADWSSDEGAFVASWTGRIDAYLDGSPLAGQGRSFAQAAWNYGVDPRWAPAISYVESSKGAACFRSHNAWGDGSSGYGSWTEGINAVCRALGGSMYGGYLTEAAARTYCPPNWQHWYNSCAAEMAKI